MTATKNIAEAPWHSRPAQDVASEFGFDPDRGLDAEEVERRLGEYGPNELPTEPPPSWWVVARGQLSKPMNIMLLIVGVASFAIGQVPTGVVVLALVTFNVVMGSNQELKARATSSHLRNCRFPTPMSGEEVALRRSNQRSWAPAT